MIVYGWLGAYLSLLLPMIALLGVCKASRKWLSVVAFILLIVITCIPIYRGSSIIVLGFGFISYLSFSSVMILALVLCQRLLNPSNIRHIDIQSTLIAFTPIVVIFYTMQFWLVLPGIYWLGFEPLWLMIGLMIYGLILYGLSHRFLGFNLIIMIACIGYLSGFLGYNFWNYLIDPILLVMVMVVIIHRVIYGLICRQLIKPLLYSNHK